MALPAWVQRGSDLNGEAAGDMLGNYVAISKNGLVIAGGAPYNDGNGANSGSVRIYAWNGSEWVKRGQDIDGEAAGDLFGSSIALSHDGSVIAIGAPTNDGTTGVSNGNTGQIRVYAWDGASWVQRGQDIDGENIGDGFGISVSISANGTVVAGGASGADSNGVNSGNARIFAWDGASWVKRGGTIVGQAAADTFGCDISLSADGTIVAISAIFNDTSGLNSGNVRIFAWDGATWVQRGTSINGQAANNRFGNGMALSDTGTVIAIGSEYYNASRGHVKVYEWIGAAWVQRGATINAKPSIDYYVGTSVSISADGSIIVIGIPENNANGISCGCARIYVWDGSAWVQRGEDIYGAAGDGAGTSVSISADGSLVAIGSPTNAANGATSGQMRAFYWNDPTAIVDSAPCFLADAPVLTPSGYRPIASLRAGDAVSTADGRVVQIVEVGHYRVPATSSTRPYTIPKRRFGALQELAISPRHCVQVEVGKMIEAQYIDGLQQDSSITGIIDYYNLELPDWHRDNMVVAGVVVESKARVERYAFSIAELCEALRANYGKLTPELVEKVVRSAQILPNGKVSMPVVRRRS